MSDEFEDDDLVSAAQRHSEIMEDGERIYNLVKFIFVSFLIVLGLVITAIIYGGIK